MRRPKIADMTDFEEVQFRLLQIRRAARRQIRRIDSIDYKEINVSTRANLDQIRAIWTEVVAMTKASFIRMAPYSLLRRRHADIVQILNR